MIAISLFQELVGFDGAIGLVAGGLLAMIIHQTKGFAYALAVVGLTMIAIALFKGGVEQVQSTWSGMVEYARANGGLARGLLTGSIAYVLYAFGYAMGENAARHQN
jgi:hypothetical protein